MELRFARPDEKSTIIEMWQYCFSDKEPFLSWYFDNKYTNENTLVGVVEGKLVCSLQMLPYKLNFHGESVDVCYIVGVATLPEARGKGYMDQLLRKSIEILDDRGHGITILLPFRYDFYRKYGWETCFWHKEYALEISELKPLRKRYGTIKRLDTENEMELVSEIYDRFIKDKNGSILRSNKDWQCLFADFSFEEARSYLLLNELGIAEGYIIFSIKDDLVNIFDMAYVHYKAYRGLMDFIYMHGAQAKKVIWKAPSDDMMLSYLDNPKEGVALKPLTMVRIVNAEKVFSLLCMQCYEIVDIIIKIEDDFAQWNTGIFRISKGNVKKLESDEAELVCSIQTLSLLAMGAMSIEEAHKAGFVQIESKRTLMEAGKLFKKKINYMNDYY